LQNIGNNLRLRWTIKPGNHLFVASNHDWKRLLLSRDDPAIIPETELLPLQNDGPFGIIM
jgi:hypothetical protein